VARFDAQILKLRESSNKAADYLLDIDPGLWAKAYFIGTRFGYNTSNVIETINKTLKLKRELLIIELLNSLWNKIIDTRFKRLELAVGAHEAKK
jgi:hypothetical protein